MFAILCALSISQTSRLTPQPRVAKVESLRILFLGNSHTASNDLTGMVKSLLESDGSGRTVTVAIRGASFLGEFASQPSVLQEFKSGNWSYIVLQGTKMSSSHKYRYEQETSLQVCRAAVASGAKTLLFPEWPRRGWDETEWILGHYWYLAKGSGAKLVPIPRCWDTALKKEPNLDLWMADGNHSNLPGAYMAACAFHYFIAGGKADPKWKPDRLDQATANRLRAYARETVLQ
jgi:hypothetical protein